ncbi:hydrolase 76 protein [Agyrium rufum]|nr:hydrolase 76 protein [Agyrium rufum]
MTYYTGNLTNNTANVGLLPSPYYWWEAGAMWGAMVDYWYYTGDTSYNDVVAQAILSQASPTNDFMMPAQHFDLGNDDQVFWALTAMSAAEYGFPNPSKPSWFELADNVFTDLTTRWNTTQCNGGIKWQIFPENAGYDYKSSIANGGFFQLSARLARYTGNTKYSDWSAKIWGWMSGIGLISDGFNVYDGSDDTINCSQVNGIQWTYNNGALIYGAAMLANASTTDEGISLWTNRTMGLFRTGKSVFFGPYENATGVMFESACEKGQTCDNDQFSFKNYISRWFYASAKVLPDALMTDVLSRMVPTAEAAARTCSGGPNNRTCATNWWYEEWGYAAGLGQQMSALGAIDGLLLQTVEGPGMMS